MFGLTSCIGQLHCVQRAQRSSYVHDLIAEQGTEI
jgi:hypothetical protein